MSPRDRNSISQHDAALSKMREARHVYRFSIAKLIEANLGPRSERLAMMRGDDDNLGRVKCERRSSLALFKRFVIFVGTLNAF